LGIVGYGSGVIALKTEDAGAADISQYVFGILRDGLGIVGESALEVAVDFLVVGLSDQIGPGLSQRSEGQEQAEERKSRPLHEN